MIPYLPVYFVYLGLDVWQIGIMRGMEPCLVFLLSPVWGAVADKFSKHKPALILALMGSSVFYCSLFFVPLISDCFTDTALTNITQGNYLISDCTVERTLTLPSSSELDPPQEQDVCSDLCQEVLDSYPVFESEENYLRCAAKSDNWECDLCGLEVYGNVSGKDQEEDGGNHGKQPAPGKQILVTVAVCETECPYLPDTANGSFDRGGSVDSFDREVCECHITTDIQTPSSMRVTYALCFLLVAISVAFNCNILAFLDAVLMQKLGVENRKDYGKHRMWGAVGFGAMAFLSGIAIDVFTSITDSSSTRFEPLFILFLVSMVCAVVVAATLRFPQHEKPEMMHHDLWSLAKQPKVLMFLFVITVEGISFGMCFSYVVIFLTRDLEASHTLLGLSILVTTMAEIPVLFMSGKIIKWIGYEGVVYATLAAYALRYLGYGLISKPWLVLPIQALHGITFGLGWPGFTNFAITNAPKGMATTLQAIMLGMYIGVGKYDKRKSCLGLEVDILCVVQTRHKQCLKVVSLEALQIQNFTIWGGGRGGGFLVVLKTNRGILSYRSYSALPNLTRLHTMMVL